MKENCKNNIKNRNPISGTRFLFDSLLLILTGFVILTIGIMTPVELRLPILIVVFISIFIKLKSSSEL
jgi:hypothetical protein